MEAKLNVQVSRAIERLPPVLRDTAMRWLERLPEGGFATALQPESVEPLVRLTACSEFAATAILREWPWIVANQAVLLEAPDIQELQAFAEQIANSDDPIDEVKVELRRFRHRFMLHVLWREITGQASLEETLGSLSDLADQLLAAAVRYSGRLLHERYGEVRDPDGALVPLVILGMGKLGGGELNFSSDIDLIFLYPGADESDGERRLSAQEYFTRWSRHIVSLLDEVTADGFAFRIDTRLRPFGDSGPPVTSFAALESYLLRHGRGWERYAYVKARIVGPQPAPEIATELTENLVTPFVYRRYLDYGVFESLREMQTLIAAEVARRDMADNIKLGPGGIREIEFIVQSLQLVRGGSRPELQNRELLTVLPLLVGRHGLTQIEAESLSSAYRFLRRIENFIQAIRDQQTHDLPTDALDRERLCVAMGYSKWDDLLADLDGHRSIVTRQFETIALRERQGDSTDAEQHQLATMWDNHVASDEWAHHLDKEGYPEAATVAERLVTFAGTTATQQIDATGRRRLREFMARLLLLVKTSEEPAVALHRVLAVVEKILRRSAYLALLNESTQVMARLVRLCERSAYIAQQIARYPVLLDELLDPRLYTARISRNELETELRDRLAAAQARDSETQMVVLGQFQRASLFRIAVADFNGNLPVMRVSDALTDLAETVLEFALSIAWHDMTAKHGEPEYEIDGDTRRAGLGIVAYGKMGGIELSYGSDLDLVFLHDSRGSGQQTNGTKPLDNTMFYARLVRRLVHFLTTQTGSGALYQIDMRLRPDGQSGLLVTSTEAFERYQEENAWTWEHQALLRARPVAGSATVAREFERIRAETLTCRVRLDTLRDDVASMRQRMRKELDKSDAMQFDLKQGSGGIGDIEFIVQYLVLVNAHEHRSVVHYPDNIRQLATLAAAGCLDADEALRLQDIYRAYRLRLHHLTLDEKQPLLPAREFAAERADVRRIWENHLGTGPA